MKYEIEQEYTDDSRNMTDKEDELQTVINKDIDHGIRNVGGIRLVNNKEGQVKFIIIVDNPSEDSQYVNKIFANDGKIIYKGDRTPDKKEEKINNPAVVEAIDQHKSSDKEIRRKAPPILYFKTRPNDETEKGLSKQVFKGLFRVKAFKDYPVTNGRKVVYNKKFTLERLEAIRVDSRWIKDFVKNDSHEHAPEVWKKWIETGKAEKLTLNNQNKQEMSKGKKELIKQVKEEIRDDEAFERFVVKLFNDGNFDLTKTRSKSDGGYDAYGTVERKFFSKKAKVEAKFYQEGKVGRETGVFNVDRDEQGYFVTTTGFTDSAKDRINHPDMELIGKEELANMLLESTLTKDMKIKKEVIREVN